MLGESGNTSNWRKHQIQTTIIANGGERPINEDTVGFNDGGSEDGIIPRGTPACGIKKNVEVTISIR